MTSSRITTIAQDVLVIALAWMCVILFAVPADFQGILGLGREGAEVFGGALFGGPPEPTTLESFRAGFRIAMLLAWAGWIGLVATTFAQIKVAPFRIYLACSFLVVAIAILMPPVLSRDAFGYVGYGKLGAAGLNPYIYGNRLSMEALGDPLARFFVRDTPLGYGPAWAALAAGVSAPAANAGLFAQAVVHKSIAAVALLLAAEGAGRLASQTNAQLRYSTFVAVVFNPLLLVEGPGMGHNDVLMLACMVWAAVLSVRHRWMAGAALMGLACAIKPVAATALPLFLLASWLRERNVMRLSLHALVAAAPFLVFSLFFGGPVLVLRAMSGQVNPGGGTALLAAAGAIGLGAGAWSVVRAGSDSSAWLSGWIPAAAVLILFGTQYRFPWYACWLVVPALTGWSEKHRILLTGASAIAVLLSWLYTV